jgi:hypothetical protein
VSTGRTTWWAKDSAWWRRERIVELGEEFGPLGPAVVDWLTCEAKAQGTSGRVKAGYRTLARGCFAPPDVPISPVVSRAVGLGLLDDFEQHDRTFTCRISGWEDEQQRAVETVKKRRQRGATPDDSPAKPDNFEEGPSGTGRDVSRSVPPSPPTGQDRTRTTTPPTPPRGGRTRDRLRSDEQRKAWAESLVRDQGADPTPSLIGEAILVASRLRSARVDVTNDLVLTQLRHRQPSWPHSDIRGAAA